MHGEIYDFKSPTDPASSRSYRTNRAHCIGRKHKMPERISLVMGHQRQAEGSDMLKALKILVRISTKEVLILPVLDDLSHQGQTFSACYSHKCDSGINTGFTVQ